MVEKAKEVWYKWIPGWLPVVGCLIAMAMQYQHNADRLDSLEKQMIAVQDYLKSHSVHTHQNSTPRYGDDPALYDN